MISIGADEIGKFDRNLLLRRSSNKVPIGFQYNSGENTDWVGVDEIRSLIKTHVDENFVF